MAFFSKIKLKKTGEVRQLKDTQARQQLADLQTKVDGMETITHNGTEYQVADLLAFVAELYGSTVWVDTESNE